MKKKIKTIIEKLTLEEKVSLLSGADFWHTEAIPKKDIPAIMVADGPHGLRKQNLEEEDCELNSAVPAICFPTAAALAASFDTELVERVGKALGAECQAENVSVLLGPGNNIKRSPLCGRNFEYFSEDPYLAGKMAAAHIRGVESTGVGTSLKHFAANNQEYHRNTSDSVVDERTLREIYLAGFEMAVKESKPSTIMCSYNKINGVQTSENKKLLTDILRDEWGYEGLVMSDWGAVKDRALGVAAGLDLEMPGCGKANDKAVIDAVKKGIISEADVDKCVERVLNLVYKSLEKHDDTVKWDKAAQHLLAREVAAECMVLLKNDEKVLPLDADDHILMVGGFAKTPRFQGGGSSHINCTQIDSALSAVQGNSRIAFEMGFSAENDKYDAQMFQKAVKRAQDADKVIVFAGLPDSYEVEGWDRKHMDLPKVQNDLIEELCKVCSHVVVVLHNGSPVAMPWIDKVQGVLEAYLAGQGTGKAVMDVLYGRVNPSGHLAETFPLRLEDNPSYLNYGEGALSSVYSEGVFVGYRYYTSRNMPVLFPFGYGLSYTKFSYGNIRLGSSEMTDADTLEVKVDVINEKDVAGKAVVQIYVEPPKGCGVRRPVRELKAFTKVLVSPHERKEVTFTLDKRAFAYYDTELADWYVCPGEYQIQVCQDAATVADSKTVKITPANPKKMVYNVNSVFGDVFDNPKATAVFEEYIEKFSKREITTANAVAGSFEVLVDRSTGRFITDMPLRSLVGLGDGKATAEDLNELIKALNKTVEEM